MARAARALARRVRRVQPIHGFGSGVTASFRGEREEALEGRSGSDIASGSSLLQDCYSEGKDEPHSLKYWWLPTGAEPVAEEQRRLNCEEKIHRDDFF